MNNPKRPKIKEKSHRDKNPPNLYRFGGFFIYLLNKTAAFNTLNKVFLRDQENQ